MASASGILPAANETGRDTSSTSEDRGKLAEGAASVMSAQVCDRAAEDALRHEEHQPLTGCSPHKASFYTGRRDEVIL